MKYQEYRIWYRYHQNRFWQKSGHTVKARSDKEARTRMSKKLSMAGFQGLSLVALPEGAYPKDY